MQSTLNHQLHIEESADALIKKLEGQGKKVKIINDDEEEEKPQQEEQSHSHLIEI